MSPAYVLDLYAEAPDPKRQWCVSTSPVQLIGGTTRRSGRAGQLERYDYSAAATALSISSFASTCIALAQGQGH
jgi:hypothetical protein